ncbi:hypothetical protein [Frondihabitans peucedani]|uniref:IPT/TIG domain-containing protein n=1 Tax=Frondihabitans peucedani TaxID=598626 RepID=A0ABP8E660_9MICO
MSLAPFPVSQVASAAPATAPPAAKPNIVEGASYAGSIFEITGWDFCPNMRIADGSTQTYQPGELTVTAAVVGGVDRVEVYPGWSAKIERSGQTSGTVSLTNERSIILTSHPDRDDAAHRFDDFFCFTVYGDLPLHARRTMALSRAEIITAGDIIPVGKGLVPVGWGSVFH